MIGNNVEQLSLTQLTAKHQLSNVRPAAADARHAHHRPQGFVSMELFTLKKNYELQWDDIPFIETPSFGREHALDAIRYGDKIWERVTNIKEFVAAEIGHFNPCGNNHQTELNVYDLFHRGIYFSVAHHKPFAPAFTWKPDAQHPNQGE